MDEQTLAVEFRNITKTFDNVVANSKVNFKVQKGTIHGIIGENGAGKSTAMNILFGMYSPDAGASSDAGEIKIYNTPVKWNSPFDAIAHGVGMVHQHFMLANTENAVDNIILGAEPVFYALRKLPSFFRLIQTKKAVQKLKTLAKVFDFEIDWETAIEDLPVGVQQRIEILKLLYRNAEILILDEPTAVLNPVETEALFINLKKLKEQGKTVLIITHKLNEIIACTDEVTVFRHGKVVCSLKTKDTSTEALAELMVGRKILLQVSVPPQKEFSKTPVLEINNLVLYSQKKAKKKLDHIGFSVLKGEIVGIAGVEGHGQSELAQILLSPNAKEFAIKGNINIFGKNILSLKTNQIRELGVSFIPENRQAQALLLDSALQENFLLGNHDKGELQFYNFLSFNKIKEKLLKIVRDYDIRPGNPNSLARQLSGGNQQKLVIARECYSQPKLLIASQPTRGVDIGAIQFIHKKIIQVRDDGAGVLLISSELEEILALSDRILVIYAGKIVAEFNRGDPKLSRIGYYMCGASERENVH
ncbi:MAG: ABC transporter ATP-binding protein [Bdellovibrio sp.]|nr:ABC transporter ATP-binding protein [Bdellovibrio sp.]